MVIVSPRLGSCAGPPPTPRRDATARSPVPSGRPPWPTALPPGTECDSLWDRGWGAMAKNIVICLDGTNNQLGRAVNTNVVRLFQMLDLADPARQVGYYDPGVGTFSSAAAWTPLARTASRYAGLMFGPGLRQNLGEAYTYLMSVFEPEDQIFVFGFSRGAYTARALTGMLEVFGIFRPGVGEPRAVRSRASSPSRTGRRAAATGSCCASTPRCSAASSGRAARTTPACTSSGSGTPSRRPDTCGGSCVGPTPAAAARGRRAARGLPRRAAAPVRRVPRPSGESQAPARQPHRTSPRSGSRGCTPTSAGCSRPGPGSATSR